MKKNALNILIVVLIIFQIVSILKINNLQGEIQNINMGMNNLSGNMRNDINNISSNIEETLKKEAGLITDAGAEIGVPDMDKLTVPIKFTLTPKEISEQTAVSLDFQGELFPMEKTGITFSVTVSRDVFGDAMPKIVIEEDGIKKTTEDTRIYVGGIKERLFPRLYPRVSGRANYSKGIYNREGTLNIDFKELGSDIKYTEMRLIIKVDDKLISDKVIPDDVFRSGYEIDEKTPMDDGQTYTMTLIATDSIGLKHHYTVDHWVAGDGAQREPWFDDERIYSADGKLLWKPLWYEKPAYEMLY